MNESTIICPHCNGEVKLTESLAAPLIESMRKEFEQKLAKKSQEIALRETDILEKENKLVNEKNKLAEEVSTRVQEQLAEARKTIEEEAKKRAKIALGIDLDNKDREILELQEILKNRDEKLVEARKAQASLVKKQRELDDEKRSMELTIEKRVNEGQETIRVQARKEAENSLTLKLSEKEQTIISMQKQIEELRRKAEQGSQQLQGEVQELELEAILRSKFPLDAIEPVPKGEFGGDILHRIFGTNGQLIGTILWETKRTKNWSDVWLVKLRSDQRTAKAEISIIVSQCLPHGVENFGLVEGVWVTHPRVALPVAMILRNSLVEIASARNLSSGQQTKMELVYQYLTGPNFRHRIEAIVEAFSSMQEDLDKERKAMTKQWEKRSKQLECVLSSTAGMYGDLQGIAGKSLQEIEGLEFKALGIDDKSKSDKFDSEENKK